ncbi:MAG: YtxH domain-containing protein [Anaerolineaceae bacterium]|nr:YtxH domain-containing protein [Anaerolineaceae bacterium]
MRKFWISLFATLLGGLVGSALVLLLTPVSGEEARERIGGFFTNISEQVEVAAKEKRLELEKQLERLRSGE